MGSSAPNSWSTTVCPSTHTLLAASLSRAPKKTPFSRFQFRICRYSALVPLIEEDQLAPAQTSWDWVCTIGAAYLTTSGRVLRMASTSPSLRAFPDEPMPPRAPPIEEEPPNTTSMFVPIEAI